MSRRSKARRSAEAALRKLYDSLPKIQCQGKCHNTCGPIIMSEFEQLRMGEANGGLPILMPLPDVDAGLNAGLYCPFLTPEKRCGIYDVRPLICRLWGVVKTYGNTPMLCPHGCKLDRLMTDQEAAEAIRKAEEISRRFFEEEKDGP